MSVPLCMVLRTRAQEVGCPDRQDLGCGNKLPKITFKWNVLFLQLSPDSLLPACFFPSELFRCSAELIIAAYLRFLVFTNYQNWQFPSDVSIVLPVEGLNEALRVQCSTGFRRRGFLCCFSEGV